MNYETILTGLIISAFILEFTGIYPGGIIVPAYLILFVNEPQRILATVIVSLITVLIYKFCSKRTFIYGRRRFIFMILTAAFINIIFESFLLKSFITPLDIRAIGILIPGLIASNFQKQGIIITLSSMTCATTLAFMVSHLLMLV